MLSVRIENRIPRPRNNQEAKACDDGAALKQRADFIGRLALEADQLDGVDLDNGKHKMVFSGADLTRCPSFGKMPAGLMPLPERSLASVTGTAEIDPKSGRLARLDLELGNDRFGQCRYVVTHESAWLGLGKGKCIYQEDLPSTTGSYARGTQSVLSLSDSEWQISKTRFFGDGPKPIF